MKDTKCEVIRQELDELMLNEEMSAKAAEHLLACADCREFQRQQTKLREIIGSLDTVNAPADFDFRLRARLAADSQGARFRYWSFAVKSLATAAILLVFGVGTVVVWQRTHQPTSIAVAPLSGPVKREEPAKISTPAPEVAPTVAVNKVPKRTIERPAQVASKRKQSLATVDFSSERANVITNSRPAPNTVAVFPIETSLQSFRVSLDDGRGNARTISLPTVSFGSERALATGNQFAPKRVW